MGKHYCGKHRATVLYQLAKADLPYSPHRLLRCVSNARLRVWYVSRPATIHTALLTSALPITVRKAHNSGRNHLQNVREYYQCMCTVQLNICTHPLTSPNRTALDPAQVQQVIDTLAREYDRRRIEMPRDLLQPAGPSFMTFGAGPLSGASDRGK